MKSILSLILTLMFVSSVFGQQWPAFRRDNARSGVTEANIDSSRLKLAWTWRGELAPDPAWDGPARWDAFNNIRDLPAMRQYDACFHPVSDGASVYFGSSSQDTLTAVDLKNGTTQWSFAAGGPIRLAPTIHGDHVLFGCDDGNAYCLNRKTGTLVWRFSPSQHKSGEQRKLLNNDRLICYYPIRTGITVRDGIAYFGASFLPWRESYICAVDVETGQPSDKKNTYVVRHEKATLEGSLLVAENRLIVPQGRVAPLVFDRSSGKSLGSLPGGGGVSIVLTEQGDVVRSEGGGPARKGQVSVFRGKERVATFPRGRSIVVTRNMFYVIDGQKLFAARRETNELKWSRQVDEPLELVMAGNTLFVGGRDHVTAVDAESGNVTWSAETNGRVFGLAIAEQRVLASTDTGIVYAFEPTGKATTANGTSKENPRESITWTSPKVAKVRTKNLQHRWVFHRSAMRQANRKRVHSLRVKDIIVQDQSSSADLVLSGSADIVQISKTAKSEAIQLSGGSFPLTERQAQDLPTEAITVESWVRIDQPEQWGGIAGCIQDDGSTEHGWLLGYRDDKFCLAIAGGGSGMTYLTATEAFKPKTWHHVVGTYNGQEMRLYVDGALAASGSAETGPISYAKKRFFTVGAYRDSNESYPLQGALQEVRIYNTALEAPNITKLFASRADDFAIEKLANQASNFITWGPVTRFLRQGEIEITYGTEKPCPSVIDLITSDKVQRHVVQSGQNEHKVVVTGLPHRRELQFQIRDSESDQAQVTTGYSIDTHFDWTKSATTTVSPEVAKLIENSINPRGLVYVIGSENKARAERLATQSQFTVVLVVSNESTAAQIRADWVANESLVYGRELSVTSTPFSQLPAASATVVMASQSDDQVRRLVRPEGGILHNGVDVVWTRDPVKGAGVWSHMYGQADNSAFGGEQLSQASTREGLVTQWIGRPGPRYQTDRQNRKPSPLAVGGRMFLQGQQRLISLDSYSGAVLWSLETPSIMRWNIPHDCSNWCADTDGVFVAAENQAWFIEGKSGHVAKRFDLPIENNESKEKSWGFISRYENQLIGSVVATPAIYTKWWGKTQWFDSTGGPDTHVVAADQLFAMNHKSGKLNWSYKGLVLHPTITIMDGNIYFVQDVTPSHIQSPTRRISLDKDQHFELVCLDAATGLRKWRHPLASFAGHIASLYLAGGGDKANRSLVLAASESTKKEFVIQRFDPMTGDLIWRQPIAWEATHHGKHISRPAIQGELLYVRPSVLNLSDGSTFHRGFPGGHGCSSYTLSENGLFSRLGETTWWDVRKQKVNRFERIRTDCWISVVPAQGMLLSAEGGGGCSCGTWLETSLGFLPRSVDEEFPEK